MRPPPCLEAKGARKLRYIQKSRLVERSSQCGGGQSHRYQDIDSSPIMDEGKQPLGEAEQEQIQQKRAVEQAEDQTGQTPASRTNITEDPSESELDPRFDRVSDEFD